MGKKKSTKKFKGTRYIAQKLTKYYKKRYPKYADALPKAREVFKNLKDNGDKVILANIFHQILFGLQVNCFHLMLKI